MPENPRDRIAGTRSRFKFPYSDTGYAFIGPALVLIVAVLVGIYALADWIGDTTATKSGTGNQPPAVRTDAPPQAPNTTK
jgi:hypothetical protein